MVAGLHHCIMHIMQQVTIIMQNSCSVLSCLFAIRYYDGSLLLIDVCMLYIRWYLGWLIVG